MNRVSSNDVMALTAYGKMQAAQYYNDDEGNTMEACTTVGQEKIEEVVAKYSDATWDFARLKRPLRLALRTACAYDEEEFEGNVQEAEGKSVTAMFGPPGELDGDNPKDYAAAVAVKLWGESVGLFDEMIGFEVFEHVLCPNDETTDGGSEEESEDDAKPTKRARTE